MRMIIRPSDGKGLQSLFAAGKFAEPDGAFVIDKLGGASPFGGTLCGVCSDYAVQIAPEGTGRSLFGPLDLTPMSGAGKAWYLKDVESGEVWSIAFSPVGERNTHCQVSYLPGRATISSLHNKIASELTIAVVPDRSCEVWRIKLENRSAKDRVLLLSTYVETCLGGGVETGFFEDSRTLIARKSLQAREAASGNSCRDLVLFHTASIAPVSFETEKSGFLGEGGVLRSPRALTEERVGGRDGLANDAIMSFSVSVDLPIEGEAEIGFCLGVAEQVDKAMYVAGSLNTISDVEKALSASSEHWTALCSTFKVSTPAPAFDALVNHWLPYEAYAGWVAQRTGGVVFDTSQLVDGLRCLFAFSASAPDLVRQNLVSFASRVCACGTYSPNDDVQVVPSAEDLLWLAAAAAVYAAETGDTGALESLNRGQDGVVSSLKQECERAIRMCLNDQGTCADMGLLDRTVGLWLRIYPDLADLGDRLAELKARRREEQSEVPEERSLPRKLIYLQSNCPTLADPSVLERIRWPESGSESVTGESCGLYCALVDQVLGVSASVDGLQVHPKLPESWQGFEMTRRFRGDTYNIRVRRSKDGKSGISLIVDGEPMLQDVVPHFGDGAEHDVQVTVG